MHTFTQKEHTLKDIQSQSSACISTRQRQKGLRLWVHAKSLDQLCFAEGGKPFLSVDDISQSSLFCFLDFLGEACCKAEFM